MAKTTAKKTTEKKPVTMADLKKQQDRIETVLCQMSEFLREATDKAVMRIDHRTREDGKALKELYHTANKINREVSLIRSGASFMQELEKAKPAEEQGLEPGDYTEASKEVADALTAMGWGWYRGSHSVHSAFISRGEVSEDKMKGHSDRLDNHYPRAEFLRRAAVTAKALGLVAVEPWKPEVGKLAVPIPIEQRKATLGRGLNIGLLPILVEQIDQANDGPAVCVSKGGNVVILHLDCRNFRKPTPQEEAKYHADIEAAKPIVPYVTRVMYDEREWVIVARFPSKKLYSLARQTDGDDEVVGCVGRNHFTVLP